MYMNVYGICIFVFVYMCICICMYLWLYVRCKIQHMRLQPSETCAACNIHTASHGKHVPHTHSKQPTTCHYSQLLKWREALEHALRQRRDRIPAEISAQTRTHTHTQCEGLWSCSLTRAFQSLLPMARMHEWLVPRTRTRTQPCMYALYVLDTRTCIWIMWALMTHIVLCE